MQAKTQEYMDMRGKTIYSILDCIQLLDLSLRSGELLLNAKLSF